MTINLTYYHVANEVPEISPDVAVVIDVLRATTTISWALKNGADSIQVFADLDLLKKSAMNWNADEKLMLGERGGKKIEGFDLGNSPLSVTKKVVKGKRLFMSTTNGTKSLQKVQDANHLFAMGLPNRRAVAEKIISLKSENVLILGSGWEGSYSLEDSLAAGALASYLKAKYDYEVNILNDELQAALALWEFWKNDILKCLKTATHGKRLTSLGDYEEDFKCCSKLDCLEIVPAQVERGVIRAS
ncbi:2-phosphosulfolactate phosphatasee [Prochlorococcus marinus str. MIT 9107]|uniref:Probable 2-phosphosulfolactate phosphatase n=1 Tax=Prochlorococcus marinus str. MIT 9116 TaxID=167544 RepID=A0A0A1ZUR5_PROMR|nr:2-phosphosulfolactate phosphatasee [Prochlorococcus marinus str. MIT 9107]KGF92004.1 2-phosphosulfolactate phosphatasee [Prochlorococcus marinus str. MIT 9116]KGF93385.1 2-phosphosulfolactate phosphatasee [Prochlorococcus marinus str. MIT 9123]